MTRIQLRGHCQHCGRLQAVLASGRMSKHGYEVKHHWFVGICEGNRAQPIERDRSVADLIVVAVREECLRLDGRRAALLARQWHPDTVRTNRWDPKAREHVSVPWDDGTVAQRNDQVERTAWSLQNRANIGRSFALTLESLCATHYGQPLLEVPVVEGPAPIPVGDRRKSKAGPVLVCRFVDRGMVHWEKAGGFRSRMSTRSWRALEAA